MITMLTFVRLLLFFLIIDVIIIFLFLWLDWLLGHRLLILIAKALRFKQDDIERTTKKIDEILGGSVEKKRKKKVQD